MKFLLILVLLAGSASARKPQVRCRVVAVVKSHVKVGGWQPGAAGCSAAAKDAEFAAKMFGDTVVYKIQMQSAGQEAFVRLDMDGGESTRGPSKLSLYFHAFQVSFFAQSCAILPRFLGEFSPRFRPLTGGPRGENSIPRSGTSPRDG